ncbi:phosphatidylglycerophosphatase A family protein [Lacticaseibacillus zhaodongensis]|uniref:phosphatidylglycerophosphatase A family protein n=1 Tax=Lacticaseibacillus zhaodongensis TaxID=2668065 RepID=UPI0012D2BE6E
MNNNFKYPDTAAYKYVIDELDAKGVRLSDIAQITYGLQHKFLPDATIADYEAEVINVMHKRELLNNAMVALQLDKLATKGQLDEPLQSIVANDVGVFGVDETLASGIATLWGSIGITNYGYIDRTKPGIIGKLDNNGTSVNTFIDDLVGAIAAAVAGKMAHKYA